MTQPTPLHAVTARAGAVFADDAGWQVPAHFGDAAAEYEAARRAAVLFDVSHAGKLELTGPDAPSFLHNLCTNDVKDLPLGGGREAFFTNAKAKVLAHTLIYHLLLDGGRHALWVEVAPGRAEALFQHLDRHLIAEQVEIADRTPAFAQVHLAGPAARPLLEKALGEPVPDLGPLEHMERTFGAGGTCHVRRHEPLGLSGYDLVCPAARGEGLWRMLTALGARPAGRDAYEVLRVEAGTPLYGPDIDDGRFVVEVGRSGAISYSKGCYLGQEPIVMARDRAGHVNRTLLGLRLPAGEPVPVGSKLWHDGTEVGVTGSSVRSPRAGAIALAYVRRGHQEPGTRLEVEVGGERRPAEVTTLPIVSPSQ